MSTQYVADSFCIGVNTLDAWEEVPAVALQEDTILSPMVILVVVFPGTFEKLVLWSFRI